MKIVLKDEEGFENTQELSRYIKRGFEPLGYSNGRIEQIDENLDWVILKLVQFVEMLVEENIITIEQLKKVF